MLSNPLQVKALDPYLIWIKFADNTEGQVDLSHLVDKPVFKNWKNPDFFRNAYIDAETKAIAWDENIELCPDSLYLKLKGMTFEDWKLSQNNYATNK